MSARLYDPPRRARPRISKLHCSPDPPRGGRGVIVLDPSQQQLFGEGRQSLLNVRFEHVVQGHHGLSERGEGREIQHGANSPGYQYPVPPHTLQPGRRSVVSQHPARDRPPLF